MYVYFISQVCTLSTMIRAQAVVELIAACIYLFIKASTNLLNFFSEKDVKRLMHGCEVVIYILGYILVGCLGLLMTSNGI